MEYTDTKKITRKEIIQIVFNILLALAIGTLLFTTITIVKKADEIQNDPIEYLIKNTDVEYCNCYDSKGTVWGSVREFMDESSRLSDLEEAVLEEMKNNKTRRNIGNFTIYRPGEMDLNVSSDIIG